MYIEDKTSKFQMQVGRHTHFELWLNACERRILYYRFEKKDHGWIICLYLLIIAIADFWLKGTLK